MTARHPAPEAERTGQIYRCHAAGDMADVAFRGRGHELVVDLGEGRHVHNVSSPVRLARGDPVGLEVDVAGSVLYDDTTIAELDLELADTTVPHPVTRWVFR